MRKFLWLTTKSDHRTSSKQYLVPISEIRIIECETDNTALVTLKTGDVLRVKEEFNSLGMCLNEREHISIHKEPEEE